MAQALASSPLPAVRLEVRAGGGRPTVYEVGDGGFLIGGVPGCDLRLPGGNVAPVVCLISRHARGASLRKLAPVQPIAVNGRNVSSTYLNNGDRVTVGTVEVAVTFTPGAGAAGRRRHAGRPRTACRRSRRGEAELQAAGRGTGEGTHPLVSPPRRDRGRMPPADGGRRGDESAAPGTGKRNGAASDLEGANRRGGTAKRNWIAKGRNGRRASRGPRSNSRKVRACAASWARSARRLYSATATAATASTRSRRRFASPPSGSRITSSNSTRRPSRRRRFGRNWSWARPRTRPAPNNFSANARSWTSSIRSSRPGSRNCRTSWPRASGMRGARAQGGGGPHRPGKGPAAAPGRPRAAGPHPGPARTAAKAAGERALEVDNRYEQLQRDLRDLEEQAVQMDEWHNRLAGETEKLRRMKQEHETAAAQVEQRAAALEGQQAMLATLRTRMERMREELRRQEEALSDQRACRRRRRPTCKDRLADVQKLREGLDNDLQLASGGASAFRGGPERSGRGRRPVAAGPGRAGGREKEAEPAAGAAGRDGRGTGGTGRFAHGPRGQLEELHNRLSADRQTQRDREAALSKAEQTLTSLQEQLRRRSEELNERQKEQPSRRPSAALEATRSGGAGEGRRAGTQRRRPNWRRCARSWPTAPPSWTG